MWHIVLEEQSLIALPEPRQQKVKLVVFSRYLDRGTCTPPFAPLQPTANKNARYQMQG